ncbi:two-component sensor histidine kinase [Clostridium polyendosporum]|uniref:histidine kinase n=1 Tax=Clostridium polyendosporum TaxID=69208 RepID=A0A919RYF1_9CLOT|nr:HAMP domain-containing sensor histidine kinase [Clostridium polyendosporum]GIM28656.1 two-component sensor histidine kinase [Clostridium polyendosporum]
MRQSISKKIFIITFGLLILLMTSAMIFQSLFFQDFYANKKSDKLISSVNKFKVLYSYDINNEPTLYKALSTFEINNNAKIGIYSSNGEVRFLPDHRNNQSESAKFLNEIFNSLYFNKDYASSIVNSNKTVTTTFEDINSNLKHIVCMTPISLNSKNDFILIAVTSFQPIEEASSIIGQFYVYVFIGMLIIGLILSLIYTNTISKPLLKLNKTAKKMSSMDFTEKYEEDREDEIGNLGKTLNFLSNNLSKALDELKEKNKKLEEDIEKERKLDKLRKDFIASVSHELKTPIGIIEGYAEGLKDNIVEGESKTLYLDIIIDEAQKMNKLVLDMLELSKLESGNIKLKFELFDIVELTNSILLKYINIIKENKLILTKKLSSSNSKLYVIGEAFKIEQVITNFITNAIKYTPHKESINIIIDEKDDRIIFLIENTGVKLNEDELEKIWLQFYRIDKSRSRAEGSSGLGLAIVRQILTLHKSNFGVKNTENGLMFFFDLPKGNA